MNIFIGIALISEEKKQTLTNKNHLLPSANKALNIGTEKLYDFNLHTTFSSSHYKPIIGKHKDKVVSDTYCHYIFAQR